MKKSLVQSLSVVLLMTMATVGYAADKKKTAEKKTENENVVEVTPSKGTTPEELAAIQVLSEICPSLIGKKDKTFNKLNTYFVTIPLQIIAKSFCRHYSKMLKLKTSIRYCNNILLTEALIGTVGFSNLKLT